MDWQSPTKNTRIIIGRPGADLSRLVILFWVYFEQTTIQFYALDKTIRSCRERKIYYRLLAYCQWKD